MSGSKVNHVANVVEPFHIFYMITVLKSEYGKDKEIKESSERDAINGKIKFLNLLKLL